VAVLQKGGTLLYPTDTIWGIGCDATNPTAVEKIYRLKKRTESKSLIILLDAVEKIGDYVAIVPDIAWGLVKNTKAPLTIIYPQAKNLAPNVIADDNSVAIRIVKNEFCIKLIRAFGKPIVSTSANISGGNPPADYQHIAPEIIRGVDYSVDKSLAGSHISQPSQIIKLEINGEFRIIRKSIP
jgi:L-threonylcarbamoyladenylate synthase